MTVQDINPFVRYARFHQNLTLTDTVHYCYDCRIFYFIDGKCSFEAGNEVFDINGNTIVYLPPATGYRFVFEEGDPHTVLVFDFDLVNIYANIKESLGTANCKNYKPERVLKYQLPEEFSKPLAVCAPRLGEILRRCTDEFLYKDNFYRETTSALIKLCLTELLRESGTAAEFKAIPSVVDYIHRHYHETELTNDTIAENFGYHPYYLSQLMKKATGETLHSYLVHYRIRMAKNFLITTDWDIGTLSWKCGFNSVAYFIKQFKIRTGLTPKQYRKKNVEKVI
ncbi:MAG: helix-turn-helix domain-containing protein [Clostridia bacterium]|nr:helix-turn-helix domain-containing protein [Clostridia bacterium]